MTYFIKQGDVFVPTSESSLNIEKKLPAGTYIVRFGIPTGFFLEPTDPLRQAGKVYGGVSRQVDRILNTFNERPGNTGVILEGEKGSGKTMLARLLGQALEFAGVPTLIVNSAFAGDAFNAFLQSIQQPCMLFFDEFEKVYAADDQNKLLTLFDGTFVSKKLIVVALNDSFRITDFFKNRPGRFFYRFQYKGLEPDFIQEYLEDKLKNKNHIKGFTIFATVFGEKFNFDMMQALVEEMNRYNEPIGVVARFVNAKPTHATQLLELESVVFQGKQIELTQYDFSYPKPMDINSNFNLYGFKKAKKKDTTVAGDTDEDDIYYRKKEFAINVPHTDLKEIIGDTFTFEGKDYKIVFKKPEAKRDPYQGLYEL